MVFYSIKASLELKCLVPQKELKTQIFQIIGKSKILFIASNILTQIEGKIELINLCLK